jgi:coenzyme F420-0:L-glutamate ligase/coenzyme F420-1:gamma-L-glutamate ligase
VLAATARGDLPRGFPAAEPEDDLIALARAGADLSLADVSVAADGSLEVRSLSEDGAPEAYVEAGALAERLRILARALRRDVVIAVVSD